MTGRENHWELSMSFKEQMHTRITSTPVRLRSLAVVTATNNFPSEKVNRNTGAEGNWFYDLSLIHVQ